FSMPRSPIGRVIDPGNGGATRLLTPPQSPKGIHLDFVRGDSPYSPHRSTRLVTRAGRASRRRQGWRCALYEMMAPFQAKSSSGIRPSAPAHASAPSRRCWPAATIPSGRGHCTPAWPPVEALDHGGCSLARVPLWLARVPVARVECERANGATSVLPSV